MDKWWPNPDLYPFTSALQLECIYLLPRDHPEERWKRSSQYRGALPVCRKCSSLHLHHFRLLRRHQRPVRPRRNQGLLRRWHLLGPVGHQRGLHRLSGGDLRGWVKDSMHIMRGRNLRWNHRLQRVPVLRPRDDLGSRRRHVLHQPRLPRRPVQIRGGLHQLSSGQIPGHSGGHRSRRLRYVRDRSVRRRGVSRVHPMPIRKVLGNSEDRQ